MTPEPLSKDGETVLDLHDRGPLSAEEVAAEFARIPPAAVLLTRAQRDALRGEIGEHSQANTIWGVEMRVVPEPEPVRNPQLLRYATQRPHDRDDLTLLAARVVEALGAIGIGPGESFDIVPHDYRGEVWPVSVNSPFGI